jgi:D-alanyl-D-alanine carboxypeptidase (penicillin-binding protein 5/6)
MISSRHWKFLSLLFPILGTALCLQAALTVRSMDPYYGAVVIDASTGAILQEDHASAVSYPASMIKLVNFFVVFDDVKAGKLRLDEPVTVTREVAQVGGRQVWLKEGEVFPLEELIYAMMVHSANDAAAALAIRASGTKEAHAARMTAKARELGLRHTVFHGVHGLPPGAGQDPDMTSALEMALLAKALLETHPEVLKYTSTSTRPFRADNPVQLTSSNKLLGKVPGCDGLKTGYFFAGGFSTAVTAQRDGRRVIAVILGCKDSKVRDAKAAEWIEAGFIKLPPLPPPPPVVAEPVLPVPEAVSDMPVRKSDWMMPVLIGLPVVVAVLIAVLMRRRTML